MRKLISLGVRCDVAFQLRMHSGDNTSHFFDWLVTPTNALLEIIKNDFKVFKPDELAVEKQGTARIIVDSVTGVQFLHHFPVYRGEVTDEFLLYYAQFIAKFMHMAGRFRQYASSHPVTFVRRKITQHEAEELEAIFFQQYPDADAKFLYVNNSQETFATKHGHSVDLPENGYDFGDPIAWADMLVREGAVAEPFRLSTAEILGHGHEGHALNAGRRFTLAHMQEAVVRNPLNAQYHREVAGLYRRTKKQDLCLEHLSIASSIDEDDVMIRIDHLQAKKENHSISESDYISGLEEIDRQVKGGEASNLLSYLKYNAGNHASAVGHFDRQLRDHPLDDRAMRFKALALFKLQKYEQCEATLRASLRLKHDDAQAHMLMALLLRRKGELDAALVEANEAIRLDPARPDTMFGLALLLTDLDRKQEAIEIYEQLIETFGWNQMNVAAKLQALKEGSITQPSQSVVVLSTEVDAPKMLASSR